MDYLSKKSKLTFNLIIISREYIRISSYVSHKQFIKYSIEHSLSSSSIEYS
jgi:hypothetical protein